MKDQKICDYGENLIKETAGDEIKAETTFSQDLKNRTIKSSYFSGYNRAVMQQIETENLLTSDLPSQFQVPLAQSLEANLTNGCFIVVPSTKPNFSIILFVGAY